MSLIRQVTSRINRFLRDIRDKGAGLAAMRIASMIVLRLPGLAHSVIYKLVLYRIWLLKYDKSKKVTIEHEIEELRNKDSILVSVIIYTRSENQRIIDAIKSVILQAFNEWELCIAIDSKSKLSISDKIQRVSDNDSRINIFNYREENDIDVINTTIEKACGKYILFLGNDDLLHPEALLWISREIVRHKNASIIYTDNDLLNDKGKRHSPDFKCNLNYEMFLQQDMLGVPVVYKKECLINVGGYSSIYSKRNKWDLSLKVLDYAGRENIIHVPRVLYHLYSRRSPVYTPQYCQKPVIDHLKRNNINASVVKHPCIDVNRIQYLHQGISPLVSIIIPTRNSVDILSTCIDSIINKTSYDNYEIIIIDNGSDDDKTLNYIHDICRKNDNITSIRYDIPFNYSRLNNLGVASCRGDIIGLVNNDVEVIGKDWMSELLSHALRDEVGAVGAKLYYPDDTIQHAGLVVQNHGVAFHVNKGMHCNDTGYQNRLQLVQEYSAVTAACLFVHKNKYLEVGGLDEDNLAVAFNDVDLCWKLNNAGYVNIWTPYAELYHHESKTRGSDRSDVRIKQFIGERDYMRKKWNIENMEDPAFSPNLWNDGVMSNLYSFPPRL